MGVEKTRGPRYSGELLTILFSIFVLAVALLIAAVRLYQQHGGALAPTALIVFALIGLAVSLVGFVGAGRQFWRAQQLPTAEPELAATLSTTEEPKEESRIRVRLGRYVEVLEEQNKSLHLEVERLRESLTAREQKVAKLTELAEELLNASQPGELQERAQAVLESVKK